MGSWLCYITLLLWNKFRNPREENVRRNIWHPASVILRTTCNGTFFQLTVIPLGTWGQDILASLRDSKYGFYFYFFLLVDSEQSMSSFLIAKETLRCWRVGSIFLYSLSLSPYIWVELVLTLVYCCLHLPCTACSLLGPEQLGNGRF